MAVKFDSTGDLLYLLSGTPNKYPRTMLCWIRIDTDNNIDTTFMMRFGDAAGTIRQGFFVRTASTDLFIGVSGATGGGAYQLVSSATLGYWFPVAMTVDTNGSSLTLNGYVGSVGRDVTYHNTVSSSDIADTSASFSIGGTGADNSGASVAFCRIYNRVLTQDEIRAELSSEVPVSTSSLYADYRFNSGALTTDSSGNGHTLTANATPAFTDNPSIGAITLRNVPTMGGNLSGGTVTLPAGKVSGDFLMVPFGTDSGAVAWGGSGWSGNTRTHINSPDGGDLQDFYKFAGSSEANVTYTFPSNFGTSWVALAYDNVNPSTPFDVAYGEATDQNANTGTVTVTTPSITTVTPNTKLLWVVSTDQVNVGTATFTPPTGFVQRGNFDAEYSQVFVADMNQAAAGATGSKSGSFTFTGGGGSGWIARLYALRPVTSGGLSSSVQEGPTTLLGLATVAISAVSTKTMANTTLSATGTSTRQASSTVTEAANTLSATVQVRDTANLTTTYAGTTVSATGNVGSGTITATSTVTEAGTTVSATAAASVQAVSSVAESGTTVSATAVNASPAVSSVTESPTTLSATATALDTAVSNVSEQGSTASGTLLNPLQGSSTSLEAPTTLAGLLNALAQASSAVTEANDTNVGAASVSVVANSNETEDPTSLSANIGAGVINAASAVQEAPTALGGVANALDTAVSTVAEARTTLAAAGTLAIVANESINEAPTTLAASVLGPGVIAAVSNVTEAPSTLSGTAAVSVAANSSVVESGTSLTSALLLALVANSAVQELADTISAAVELHITANASALEVGTMLAATLRELGPDVAIPFVLRGDTSIAFDLGLVAILADGKVRWVI